MTAKTNAQRSKDHRDKMKKLGLKQIRGLWARPVDHAAIKAYAAKLARVLLEEVKG